MEGWWIEPTKDGLGKELSAAIRLDPDRFEVMAKTFEGLDPTYVRAFLQTFHDLSQNGRTTNWPMIAGLAERVVKQPRVIPDRTGEAFDQDPDWGWTRSSITSLIATGLNRNSIPFELREQIWRIVEILAEDPNPTPEEESSKQVQIEDSIHMQSIPSEVTQCRWQSSTVCGFEKIYTKGWLPYKQI